MFNYDDLVDRTEGLLKLIGKDMADIIKLRKLALIDNKNPVTLRIPRVKFLGMDVEFADVTQPEIVTE